MSEKITCPFCDHQIDIDLVEMADMWRKRAELAARFGNGWKVVNEYVDTFRKAQGHRMALKKRIRILESLLELWEKGMFKREGKSYRADKNAVMGAMRKVCNMEKTGLPDNHSYLFAVLIDGAERVSAEGLTAREEAEKEEGRRLKAEGRSQEVQAENETVPWGEHTRRLGEIARNIGRPMP